MHKQRLFASDVTFTMPGKKVIKSIQRSLDGLPGLKSRRAPDKLARTLCRYARIISVPQVFGLQYEFLNVYYNALTA